MFVSCPEYSYLYIRICIFWIGLKHFLDNRRYLSMLFGVYAGIIYIVTLHSVACCWTFCRYFWMFGYILFLLSSFILFHCFPLSQGGQAAGRSSRQTKAPRQHRYWISAFQTLFSLTLPLFACLKLDLNVQDALRRRWRGADWSRGMDMPDMHIVAMRRMEGWREQVGSSFGAITGNLAVQEEVEETWRSHYSDDLHSAATELHFRFVGWKHLWISRPQTQLFMFLRNLRIARGVPKRADAPKPIAQNIGNTDADAAAPVWVDRILTVRRLYNRKQWNTLQFLGSPVPDMLRIFGSGCTHAERAWPFDWCSRRLVWFQFFDPPQS